MEEDIKYAKMIIKELQIYGDLDGIDDIRQLKIVLEHFIQSYKELRQENHNLKEKLENYITRRRVRRIYKQVKKILEQDRIVDNLESEEKDE